MTDVFVNVLKAFMVFGGIYFSHFCGMSEDMTLKGNFFVKAICLIFYLLFIAGVCALIGHEGDDGNTLAISLFIIFSIPFLIGLMRTKRIK